MATEEKLRARMASLLTAGVMVACRWPGSGDLHVLLQRSMISDSMTAWRTIADVDRTSRMKSVRRAIKTATKRMKRGRLQPREMDALAADIALFVGHELIYADGERWLVKAPRAADLGLAH